MILVNALMPSLRTAATSSVVTWARVVATVAVGPGLFAYVVGVCFSLDLGVVKDTYPLLLASVAYGLVITLSVGTLILALSSLTRRSLYVGIAWAGFWVISGSVGNPYGILDLAHRAIIGNLHAIRYSREADVGDDRGVGQGIGAAGHGQALPQAILPSRTTQAITGKSPRRQGDR